MRAAPAALLALMAIGTLSAIETAPAAAHDYGSGYGYPVAHDYGYAFCMRTRWDSDDCRYSSYQQCQWTASGLGATCFANPALAFAEPVIDEPAPQRHHRHRRVY